MLAAATPRRDPLMLRLLLQVVRPETEQINVHRWVSFFSSFFFGYLLWGSRYLTSWRVFVGGSALILTSAAISTVVTAYLVGRAHSRYPEPGQARRRLGTTGLGLVLMGFVLTGGALWLFDALHIFGYRYTTQQGLLIFGLAFVFDLGLAGFFEISFAFQQWQTQQLESEHLTEQQLQSQLNAVKQQVNPHFLFNSLSSLSVLIDEDPAQAERFVDELARVYRYQLQATRGGQQPGPTELVPLEAELRFLRSYAYLLGVRYGAGLHLLLPALSEAEPGGGRLLPLSLQTLVDNAIRHNVLTAGQPLRIEVVPQAGSVRVRNNRRPRTVRVPMSTEGLSSLQARYQRLTHASLHIEADDDYFTVALPLLASA